MYTPILHNCSLPFSTSSLLPLSFYPHPPLSLSPSSLLTQDDRYFLSGSLDGKLRLWNIPDKKVALWNEIEGVGKFDHVTVT